MGRFRRIGLKTKEVLFKCFKVKTLESLVFKEDGCVSVRDAARDVIFVDYLKVEIEKSVVEIV